MHFGVTHDPGAVGVHWTKSIPAVCLAAWLDLDDDGCSLSAS